MTPDSVVDASVVGAMLFGEPEAEAMARRLDGVRLVAPSIIEDEIANICVTKLRRFPDQESTLMAALAELNGLGITLCAVDRGAVVALAVETGLSAYDAAYLWLARARDADLVTLDRRLAAAFAPSPGTP